MPLARNGGHRLMPWRNRLAFMQRRGIRRGGDSVPYGRVQSRPPRIATPSEEDRSHLPAVASDQLGIVDHLERVDQRLARQPAVEVAVVPQHLDELLQRGLVAAG